MKAAGVLPRGDNNIPPTPSVNAALVRAILHDWEKEIIVTAGAIEGITASILAITSPGDEIIIPTPTYAIIIKTTIQIGGSSFT